MSRDRELPLTPGESIWIAVAAGFTVTAALMLLAGPNVQNFVTRPASPSAPVHSPLPDLCTVFPGGVAGGLRLRADPGSRVLDRSEAACSYAVAGAGREAPGSVQVEAIRPEPVAALDPDRASELKEARRTFRQRSEPRPGSGPFRRSPGPGDEAGYTTEVREYGTETTFVARDGVLLIRVRYDVREFGPAGSRIAPATVEDTARRIAAELLARLPREGA